MLTDLVVTKPPPPNREGFCSGGVERHLTEGAVMLAYGMHLLRTTSTTRVDLHPDGEHGKIFDFKAWIEAQGFALVSVLGTTVYGGIYRANDGREIKVFPKPGIGDVVTEVGSAKIIAECKGGIINTKHPGQTSRLRRGLCEAVGLLLASEWNESIRQVAVVPLTPVTHFMARRLALRTARAGLSIALVDAHGSVTDVEGAPHAL